ncbi:MAG: multidrug transporter [Candidatus Accumulibacter sp.]|nr:multidrug transporter [Accumulibacter sp.]
MDIFLQIWGGAGYLLAKIALSHAEGLQDDRKWRLVGWASYLIGLPAWVILLAEKNNWIAVAIEAGGAPALVLGLVTAWTAPPGPNALLQKSVARTHAYFDRCVKIVTWLAITAGISYSIYYFNGITAISQVLEIGVTFGFLLGSYLLAKKNPAGWLLFAVMVISMGILMLIQDKIILFFQQLVSLAFILNGFIRAMRKRNTV